MATSTAEQYGDCVTRWFWNGTAIEGAVDVYSWRKGVHLYRVRTGVGRPNKNEALIDALDLLKTARETGIMGGQVMEA